jgi:hypothetical protein
MYRRFEQFVLVTVCVTLILMGVLVNPASACSGGNFILSAQSNSIWVLNKSSRKMMFIQLEEKEVWKSHTITIPAGFDMEKCKLEAVGGRGTSVFLYDKTSGKVTLYKVKKDHTIHQFPVVDAGADLK